MRFHKFAVTLVAALGLSVTGAVAKEYKNLVFGMDASYPPFESINPQGEVVGFEVDYAKAICERIKVSCKFQNQDWDGIIPALLTGKIDVIFSSMSITEPRKKRVIFSQVYYTTPPVFIGQASNKSDDVSPAALKGKTIATQSSTPHANYLERFYKDSQVKLYPTQDEANADLANGRVDYVFADQLSLEVFVEKSGGCCRVVAKIPRDQEIYGPGIGAAFRPDDTDLRDAFNKAIDELDADGTYQKIAAKYFKTNIRGK